MTTSTSPRQFLSNFDPSPSSHDEIVDANGMIRPYWGNIVAELDELGTDELLQRQTATIGALDHDGVTYNSANDGSLSRRRWQLDALPTIIPEQEWNQTEVGFIQRAELLNLVLSDLYGERRLLSSGVLPLEMILSDPMFLRSNDGIRLPGEKQLFLTCSDLVRGADSTWTVLSDRTQVPSGAGYTMEDRSVISQLFPRLYRSSNVRRISPFFEKLRAGLSAVAPAGVDKPRAVVLSPGVLSETAFEHAFLAAELGIPLVEGSDLSMRDGSIWMQSISGPKPVHIIVRRVDGWFCDPLELRGDSQLGVTGLNEACRRGTVSIVNPIGSGVCENNGLNAYLPELCRYFFGEDLHLRSAQSWWCGDPASMSHVVSNLSDMVIRPTSRLLESQTVFGSELSSVESAELIKRIKKRPHLWVGQERIEPATTPTFIGGNPSRRRSVLRTFAVADADTYYVLPGGLTRVANKNETLHVTNRSGAAAKDTWVLRGTQATAGANDFVDLNLNTRLDSDAAESLSSRAAENLFWLGRYAERAEAAARIIRSVNRRRLDFQDSRPGPGLESLDVLLRAITHVTATYPGFTEDGATTHPFEEIFSLIVDPERSGSIRHSIDRLLSGSEVVREQMSRDNWLVAGSLQQHLIEFGHAQFNDREEAIQRSLGQILSELLALSGIGAESLVRDPAWCYLDIGRRIERATQTLRLLQSCLEQSYSQQTEKLVVLSLLSASESSITYRRRYRSGAHASSAINLLIFAKDNPRSVVFQLDRLAEDLDLLAELTPLDKPRVRTLKAYEKALRLLLTVDVETLTRVDETVTARTDLQQFTTQMISTLAELSSGLSDEDFPHITLQQSITIPNLL